MGLKLHILPAILIAIVSIKMFLFKRCFVPEDNSAQEREDNLRAEVEATRKALHQVEDELAELEAKHNSDICKIDDKSEEVQRRRDYVAELKSAFSRSLSAEVVDVSDFQSLCEKFTLAQSDLNDTIVELQTMNVEFNLKYEEWSSQLSAKKDEIERLNNRLVDLENPSTRSSNEI